jgi:hypothetical protein
MNNFPYAKRISSCTTTSCWHYILYKFIRAAKTPLKMHSSTWLARNVGDETNQDTHWWHEYRRQDERRRGKEGGGGCGNGFPRREGGGED